MKPRDLEVAWTRTCDGLGLSRGASLSIDEASVLLKYLVAEGAAAPGNQTRGCATQRARVVLHQVIDGGFDTLVGLAHDSLPPGLRETAYVLACDAAAAAGKVSQEEIQLREMLRHGLSRRA